VCELELLSWTKLKWVTTGGTSIMITKETGLMGRIWINKTHILCGISLPHPPTVTLWKNFEA